MNYNTFEQCDLLRRGSRQLVNYRKDCLLCEMPPELLHLILNFLVKDFKDLIVFSTINKTCKRFADYSLHWLKIDLSFKLPERFTATFPLDGSSFSIPLDLTDRYRFPTYSKVYITHQRSDLYPYNLITTNRHQIANTLRNKFMKCLLSYLKKADEYLLYYNRAERIHKFFSSSFLEGLLVHILVLASMLSFSLSFLPCEINHLSIFNHLFFLSLIFMLSLLCFAPLLYIIQEISLHIIQLDRVYLDRVFDNFEWEVVYFLLRDFVFCLGILFTFILIYIKCIDTLSISYWWITMIPIRFSIILSLSIYVYPHRPIKCPPLFFILTVYYLVTTLSLMS